MSTEKNIIIPYGQNKYNGCGLIAKNLVPIKISSKPTPSVVYYLDFIIQDK